MKYALGMQLWSRRYEKSIEAIRKITVIHQHLNVEVIMNKDIADIIGHLKRIEGNINIIKDRHDQLIAELHSADKSNKKAIRKKLIDNNDAFKKQREDARDYYHIFKKRFNQWKKDNKEFRKDIKDFIRILKKLT